MSRVPVIQASAPSVRLPCWTFFIQTAFCWMPAVVCAEKCHAVAANSQHGTTPQCLEWTGCMLPLHVAHCMLCMCVAYISSPAVGPESVVCMLVVYAAVCVCICVFAARPQYKRGHRKTASFGTILDVPKIVVTGITGPLDHWASWWPGRAGLAEAVGCSALTWPSPVCYSIRYQP